tara:strand:- start:331 stop:735 length:405 start_codon:yes stop_codon:yes gene_type:complete
MCMGGGGNRATITQPDYSAYNQQFELQKAAIDQQMSNSSMLMQQQLQSSLRKQTFVREEIRDAKVAKAEKTDKLEEQAQRLSVLMGTPPPEPNAQAPEIGVRDRGINTRKGKSSMRIGRKTAKGSAKGTGLNIT